MPRTFAIIDGSSLMHRAFYALPLLTTIGGQYTNAVYGFTTMLLKLLSDVKPEAVAVAFDKGRITFRNDIYAQYKGHRKATPSELAEQFPLVKEVLAALGIAVLEQAGYEADDIIGTLSVKACQAGHNVIIVTGDRDALQLIGPNVNVMLTKKGISDMEMFDSQAFQNKYGITSAQMIDLKGLMGDTSDNIPGVPGIGEKTAAKLIAEFGSIENLIDNIDKVSGKKLQENLRNNMDLAVLSKKLSTIVCDMALDFEPDAYHICPDRENLLRLLTNYEFKSLLTRIDDIFPGNSLKCTKVSKNYPEAVLLTDYQSVAEAVGKTRDIGVLKFYPVIAGQIPDATLQGMALILEGQAVYIAAGVRGWDELLSLLTDSNINKVTYDAKKFYNACNKLNIAVAGVSFDILLAAYLLDPTAAEYPLDLLLAKYLNRDREQHEKTTADPAFACWAANAVGELQPLLKEHLAEAGLEKLYYEIEMPLAAILASLEHCGITVDTEYLRTMSGEIAVKINALLHEIYGLAGEEFNVNSTKQLGVILFEKLKLPVIKKTKTGYSTDAEVLEKLAGQHPLIDRLLEYRLLTKLKSTYLDGMESLVNVSTNRIHTTFNQTVTATGRLSSSDPNLQNIPIRTEIGRRIRELFVPGQGFDYIMSADYSQIELRILAHMSGDENLIDAFKQNQDIHTRTAAEVFGVPMDQVTSEMRARAKAVNFGIVYGISDYGLSRDIGVSRKEAGHYIDSYFAKYHGVKAFIDVILTDARRLGYVTTLFGRRRYLPDITSSNFNQRSFAERTAMNTPIQGTAADIIKKAMIDVYSILHEKQLCSRILLQVHDELVLEVVAKEADLVGQVVKQAMEQAVSLSVPMTADVKLGKNWAEAK